MLKKELQYERDHKIVRIIVISRLQNRVGWCEIMSENAKFWGLVGKRPKVSEISTPRAILLETKFPSCI